MNIIRLITLVFGLLGVAVGCVKWRTWGRGPALGGATLASFAAYMHLAEIESAFRYPALAVFLVITFFFVTMSGRPVWRQLRIELLLASATIFTIWAWQLWPAGPSGVKFGLVILVGVFGASFVAVAITRFVRLILNDRQNRLQATTPGRRETL